MTPKEKAEELYAIFDDYPLTVAWKKACAVHVVDEILKVRPGFPYPHEIETANITRGILNIVAYPEKYWKEVKEEIEKL